MEKEQMVFGVKSIKVKLVTLVKLVKLKSLSQSTKTKILVN